MSVQPDLRLQSNVLFKAIDINNQTTKIFVMEGLGTKLPSPIISHKTEGNFPHITAQSYESRGEVRDTLDLIKDLKSHQSVTRRERLDTLINSIKEALVNQTFNQVILIGCSHGSIIMYSALVEIEADITIPPCLLRKLRFYAVTPPTFFPANTLTYNSTPAMSGSTSSPITILPSLPFAHIHYRDDPFFNINVKNDNVVLRCFLRVAKSTILKRVSNYFQQVNNTIQNIPPDNKCFYYDKDRQVIFTIPFPPTGNTSACVKNQFTTYFNDDISAHIKVDGEYRYWGAFQQVKGKLHADITLLYPVLEYIEISKLFFRVYTGRQGGKQTYINILGKKRRVHKKGRWSYVTYKKELITIQAAKKLELGLAHL
jgi:hypothetical protein